MYVDKTKRTVPMEQLEKDHQTGVQIAAEDTECAPWRSFEARTKIWGRKRIIYSLLSAEKSGEDLTVYMQGLKEEAEKVLQAAPKKKGVKTTLISTMQKLLLAEHDVGNPVSFEMEVLRWNVTPAIQKQAISKQKGNVAAE